MPRMAFESSACFCARMSFLVLWRGGKSERASPMGETRLVALRRLLSISWTLTVCCVFVTPFWGYTAPYEGLLSLSLHNAGGCERQWVCGGERGGFRVAVVAVRGNLL